MKRETRKDMLADKAVLDENDLILHHRSIKTKTFHVSVRGFFIVMLVLFFQTKTQANAQTQK
jgi:hypothetical protein